MENLQNNSYEKILDYAFKLLGQRRYTEYKLTQKLKTRFKNNCDIPKVISRLNDLKYLDDFDYAKAYIRSILSSKPCGKYLLAQKLKIQGLKSHIVQKAIEESQINEQDLAEEALNKKLSSLAKLPQEKRVQKALYFLKSRGFKSGTIYKTIEQIPKNC